MEEIWKDIEGYEGLYQISNYGNIKSLPHLHKTNRNYNKIGYISKERNLKFRTTKRGYNIVTLYKNKIAKTYYIHRLVATNFIFNSYNRTCVNHINGNKQDNRVNNLEWCTYSENMLHAYAYGLNHT